MTYGIIKTWYTYDRQVIPQVSLGALVPSFSGKWRVQSPQSDDTMQTRGLRLQG